ncbi:uncharacterized protein UMAG_01118 [Mycosarcoma maydis]|uniref:Uncharacterized protein n=1 Tax=Mycosarcoma maydis TaxID=5270 RepID=A0A0D1CXX0_MYCMD|nr:uncharacterized protein UMAG_01118 [Ustilago maydis 521]KIS71213.1 hypothetical protein UMAG_01118 [Ustilago maydis 521]|eukprot:XP_011387072.1 hypothetical protein UMAG_01118 [Ustilago maydis 521]
MLTIRFNYQHIQRASSVSCTASKVQSTDANSLDLEIKAFIHRAQFGTGSAPRAGYSSVRIVSCPVVSSSWSHSASLQRPWSIFTSASSEANGSNANEIRFAKSVEPPSSPPPPPPPHLK